MDYQTLASRVSEVAQLTGEFRLRSGLVADTYFDKYQFESDPVILQAVASAMVDLIPDDLRRRGAVVRSAVCVIDREQVALTPWPAPGYRCRACSNAPTSSDSTRRPSRYVHGLCGGVIAWRSEHGVEVVVGEEVSARLTDRLEMAVELAGPFAVDVADILAEFESVELRKITPASVRARHGRLAKSGRPKRTVWLWSPNSKPAPMSNRAD